MIIIILQRKRKQKRQTKKHAQLQMQSHYFGLINFASLIVANSSKYIIFVPLLIYSVFVSF